MKSTFVYFTTVLLFVLAAHTGNCQTVAFINNQVFESRDIKPVTATATEPQAAADNVAKTIVNIAMTGKDGETINMSLALDEPVSPGMAASNVALYHNGVAYTMQKNESNVEVTDFIWSMDRKSFILSLSYNCTMQSADGKGTINLKGKVQSLKVMVPGAASASN